MAPFFGTVLFIVPGSLMQFTRTDSLPDKSKRHSSVCYLINDNWDDFSFKTSFDAVLYDPEGARHDLGPVRILKKGLERGRVPLPAQFSELGDEWCSLGNDRDYYLSLSKLQEPVKRDYLRAIRDCAFDPAIFESFKNEEGMQSSLLRTVTTHDVRVNFPRILRGDTQLTAYEFIFEFETGSVGTTEKCEFSVEPDSMPPTNVHVLIGRNGVGKTRLLAGMADALTENKVKSMGLIGEFQFGDDANEFLNTIVVSYSAFDRFDPLNIGRRRSKTSIPYFYIGIKKQKEPAELGDTVADSIVLKNASDFNYEFRSSLNALADQASKRSHRYGRWLRALDVLRSDPGLAEFVSQFFGVHQETNLDTQAEQFALLSSGHKIVLLTVAKLVENVSDRSLILMDEPETHLHPPLLGSFIRAVSDLLTSQNGVAIIATHSPVVLQEVPARCVSVITRSGHRIRIRRPKTETFAENVGMLTRRVFGLEVTQSGFYRLLKEAAEGRDFGDVLKEFGDQIGGEGRALARVFTSENDEEE